MRRAKKVLVGMSLALLVCSTLHAQDDSDKINSNIGAAVSLPLNPTSKFVKTSWGLVGGAGYNLSTHHSVIGEFMWSALYPSASSLQPIRVASNDNSITGHSNLYAITGNYRYELQGKLLGAYFIGGGGWYYRTIGFSKPVTSGGVTVCVPAWVWWGFTCASGTVTANQTVASYDSSAFGGNAGVGFTIKVADPSYRIYIEPRYHYAPTRNVTTQLIEVTVGIRY
jgi:Outer membrane protein beta-barrel domain